MKKKLMVTAALTGGGTIPTQSPYIPITPKQLEEEAKRVENAGAACVHIHPRDPIDGHPTADTEVYMEILSRIHQSTNLVICTTTGFGRGFTAEERIRIVRLAEPELASHDIGSLGGTRDVMLERFKDKEWKYSWEKPWMEKYKTTNVVTTQEMIEDFAGTMQAVGTKPEYEIFDLGWLNTLDYLRKRYNAFCKPPLWIQFVHGYFGCLAATPEQLVHVKRTADDLFGKDTYEWQAFGIGYPAQFQMCNMSILMGGHARVGLEDNLYMKEGVLAKSNAEQVERVVQMARNLDRELATSDEARQILNLKGKDKVKLPKTSP